MTRKLTVTIILDIPLALGYRLILAKGKPRKLRKDKGIARKTAEVKADVI